MMHSRRLAVLLEETDMVLWLENHFCLCGFNCPHSCSSEPWIMGGSRRRVAITRVRRASREVGTIDGSIDCCSSICTQQQ